MLVLLIGFPSSAVNFSVFADDDDEIELEAELVDPSTGEDGGKAKFEKRLAKQSSVSCKCRQN